MNYKTFCDVVTSMKSVIAVQNAYIDSMPPNIDQFILENTYTELDGQIIDKLSRALFGEHYEDVAWFLYEQNEQCNRIWYEDREYPINNIEEYLVYAKKELFNE